ncbi:hypothetical protein [Fictibacillus macauensis]|uniref:hypothetical protein n=1 Tax=Fictibacillus macauensis TaxID=245160 RepID=UPI0012E9CDA7|nr:hypothetical protein [Fictibacillus macauensis]
MEPKTKDLDKIVRFSIKEDLKKLKIKSRGGIYFKRIEQYFIYIYIYISEMQNEERV